MYYLFWAAHVSIANMQNAVAINQYLKQAAALMYLFVIINTL